MGILEYRFGQQPRWGPLKHSHRDLASEEHLLDNPSISSRRIDELLEEDLLQQPESKRTRFRSHICWLTAANMLMLGVAVVLTIHSMLRWKTADIRTCVKATSFYCNYLSPERHIATVTNMLPAPVIESKNINFHHVQLNGTLWPAKNPSWSRKEIGNPEAETIWEAFELVQTFPITRDDVISLGKDPETVARYPDEDFGLGDEAYIAAVDIQHKIHCLNELRKMAFVDYGKTKPKGKARSQLSWIHLRHCLDMLTQDLLCHADADLITYRWVDTQPYPFPDMSINRQCRNIDDVLQYRDEHKVDADKYLAMQKPKSNITQVPSEPGYYASKPPFQILPVIGR